MVTVPRAAAAAPRRPQTIILVLMYTAAIFSMYMMRANMSFAMDGPVGMAAAYGWSKENEGLCLSGFFFGYLFSQVIGGWCATRFGGKIVLLYSMILCSLLTGLTPVASTVGLSATVAVRSVLGFCSGVVYPVLSAMFGRWITSVDRSKAYAVADFGGILGAAGSGLLAPVIMPDDGGGSAQGWVWMFNYPAIFGLAWSVAWYLLVHSSPEEHPTIGAAERDWILARLKEEAGANSSSSSSSSTSHGSSINVDNDADGGDGDGDGDGDTTAGAGAAKEARERGGTKMASWSTLLLSPALLGQYSYNFSGNWMFYTLLTFLPQYMTQQLGFDIAKAGPIFAVPQLCFGVGEVMASWVADKLIKRRTVDVLTVRTWMPLLAAVPMLGTYLAVALAGLSVTATVVAFSVVMFFNGIVSLNPFLVGNDLYPESAGPAFGISNTIGTIPGVVSPILSGILLKQGHCPNSGPSPPSCRAAWTKIFIISIVIYAVGLVFYAALIRFSRKGVGYDRLQRNLRIADAKAARRRNGSSGSDGDGVQSTPLLVKADI